MKNVGPRFSPVKRKLAPPRTARKLDSPFNLMLLQKGPPRPRDRPLIKTCKIHRINRLQDSNRDAHRTAPSALEKLPERRTRATRSASPTQLNRTKGPPAVAEYRWVAARRENSPHQPGREGKVAQRRSGHVTLLDIARACGFSVSTVSIVLSEAPLSRNVAASTRQQIRAMAQTLGYHPSAAAEARPSGCWPTTCPTPSASPSFAASRPACSPPASSPC